MDRVGFEPTTSATVFSGGSASYLKLEVVKRNVFVFKSHPVHSISFCLLSSPIGLVLIVSHYVMDLHQLSTCESLRVLVVSWACYKMK
jgi:hypothetical protein